MSKDKAETIAYAIKKECQRSSLYDWCESWDITIDEFEEFLSNGIKECESNKKCIEIVQEVAEEYNGGWIPCSERLPDDAFGCLVTVIDCEPSTQTDFENILPYFVGYDGYSWNDADGNVIPFEVIAWQPLPEQFKESD